MTSDYYRKIVCDSRFVIFLRFEGLLRRLHASIDEHP